MHALKSLEKKFKIEGKFLLMHYNLQQSIILNLNCIFKNMYTYILKYVCFCHHCSETVCSWSAVAAADFCFLFFLNLFILIKSLKTRFTITGNVGKRLGNVDYPDRSVFRGLAYNSHWVDNIEAKATPLYMYISWDRLCARGHLWNYWVRISC
jgi:hypothetical protein